MEIEERGERIKLALDGLVPMAFMERVMEKCEDFRHPRLEEILPTEEERESLVDIIVMADVLVAGARTQKEHEKAAKALTAIAKTIAILAWNPGGVVLLGRKWFVKEGRLSSEDKD